MYIDNLTPPLRQSQVLSEDAPAQTQHLEQPLKPRSEGTKLSSSPAMVASNKEVQGQKEGENMERCQSLDPSVPLPKPESPDDMMDLGSDGESGPAQQSFSESYRSESWYDADDERMNSEDVTTDISTSPEKLMGSFGHPKGEPIVKTENTDSMDICSSQAGRERKRKTFGESKSDEDTNLESRKVRKFKSEDDDGDEDGGEDEDEDEDELEDEINEDTSHFNLKSTPAAQPTKICIEAPEPEPGAVRPAPLTWMTYQDTRLRLARTILPKSLNFCHPRQPISGYTYSTRSSCSFAREWCQRKCDAWRLMWDLEDVQPEWLCEFFQDILPGVYKPVHEGMMATALMYRAVQLVCFRHQHELVIIDLAGRSQNNPKFFKSISPSYRHYISTFSYFRRFQAIMQVNGKTKEIFLARPIPSKMWAETEMRNWTNNENRKKRGLPMMPSSWHPLPWDQGLVFPLIPDYPYTFESAMRYDPMHPFRMDPKSERKTGIPPMKYGYEEWMHLIKLMHQREGGSLRNPHKATQWRNRCITIHEKEQGDTRTDLCGLLQECEEKMIGMRSAHMVEDCAEVDIYGVCICGPLAMMVRLRKNCFMITDVYDLRGRAAQREFLWLLVNAVADVFWKANVSERGGSGGFPGPGLSSSSGVPDDPRARKAEVLVREDLEEDTEELEDAAMGNDGGSSDDGFDDDFDSDYEPYVDELEEEYYEYVYEDNEDGEVDGSGDKKEQKDSGEDDEAGGTREVGEGRRHSIWG
ncbi:hypothetical protein TWF506_001540 [Arthrobotrys conoides]|uniref:Uncharacterized protein n=1 Tax=Arthrobotrys conoides TaxID=74498 RepID=A0AAN8P9Z1_9PEZI